MRALEANGARLAFVRAEMPFVWHFDEMPARETIEHVHAAIGFEGFAYRVFGHEAHGERRIRRETFDDVFASHELFFNLGIVSETRTTTPFESFFLHVNLPKRKSCSPSRLITSSMRPSSTLEDSFARFIEEVL